MIFEKTDTNSANVHEIFTGETMYRLPLFQRGYVWEKAQLDALWSDIDTVIDESAESRFLGALVLQAHKGRTATRPMEYWVIDGQQRLTTFYMIFVCCVNQAVELEDPGYAEDLARSYLLQTQRSVRNEPKVIPTIPDLAQFKEILQFIEGFAPKLRGGDFGNSAGPMVDAYLRLNNEIEKRITVDGEPSIEALKTLVDQITEKIEFVQINLADHHDANEVFNRLNDSGQPLEIIDLVRNEVFSLLTEDTALADQIYNADWLEFEKAFDLGDTKELVKKSTKMRSEYFFPFALIKDPTVKKAELFKKLSFLWRSRVEEKGPEGTAKSIISDLQEYVPAYLALAKGQRLAISDQLTEAISRFHRMPAPTTLYPYAMRALKELLQGNILEDDVISCFEVIESFLVRRAFLGMEPTGLHAVLRNLWGKAGVDRNKVKENIQTRTIEFPDDDRFAERIKEGDLYHRRLCAYVVEEYERSFTAGDVLKKFPPITIDHVMPQSYEGDWVTKVASELHEKYLHTWANLVPLSGKANSEKSRSSYSKVKDLLATETVFSTTKNLLDENPDWDVAAIEKRAEKLTQWALGRWVK